MKKFFIFKLMIIAIAVTTVISCNDDDDECYYVEQNDARGLIVNASPNSGDLYFFADENKINGNALNYANAQGYYRFYDGMRTFTVRDNNGNILDTEQREVNGGDVFSLFAINNFDQLELVSFEDHLEAPGFYRAGIRLINLSPDAPNVDIYLDGHLITSDIPFKTASPFVNVDDDEYNVEIKDTQTGNTLFQKSSVVFYPNRIYTLYTKGFVNAPSGSNDKFSLEIIRNY